MPAILLVPPPLFLNDAASLTCLMNFLSQIVISNNEILVFRLRKGRNNNKKRISISCKRKKNQIFFENCLNFFILENHEMAGNSQN